MKETQKQDKELKEAPNAEMLADWFYHAKIEAFVTGFIIALSMIGAVYLFVLKVLT